MKRQCKGTGQKPIYKHGVVHPYCPECDQDLSVQGKHQKVRNGIIGKHFVEISVENRNLSQAW